MHEIQTRTFHQQIPAVVWKIFNDSSNMDKWQSSLINIERVSGVPGQPGAIAKLTFRSGEREFSLIEKVTFRAEPERLDSVYENEFAANVVKNTFLEQGRDATLWKVEVIFKFKTLFMKILGPLKKKNLVIRTQNEMQRFKEMTEGL